MNVPVTVRRISKGCCGMDGGQVYPGFLTHGGHYVRVKLPDGTITTDHWVNGYFEILSTDQEVLANALLRAAGVILVLAERLQDNATNEDQKLIESARASIQELQLFAAKGKQNEQPRAQNPNAGIEPASEGSNRDTWCDSKRSS